MTDSRVIWKYDLDEHLRDTPGWCEVRDFLMACDAYDDLIALPSTVEVTEEPDGTRHVTVRVYDEGIPLCSCGESGLTHTITRRVTADPPSCGRHKGKPPTLQHATDLRDAAVRALTRAVQQAAFRVSNAEDQLERAIWAAEQEKP